MAEGVVTSLIINTGCINALVPILKLEIVAEKGTVADVEPFATVINIFVPSALFVTINGVNGPVYDKSGSVGNP